MTEANEELIEMEEEKKEGEESEESKDMSPEAIDKAIEELGCDFDFDPDYQEPSLPSVRIYKYITMNDAIKAEQRARVAFQVKDDEEPTFKQTQIIKLSMAAKFNGKTWTPLEIGELPSYFLTLLFGKFAEVLT